MRYVRLLRGGSGLEGWLLYVRSYTGVAFLVMSVGTVFYGLLTGSAPNPYPPGVAWCRQAYHQVP